MRVAALIRVVCAFCVVSGFAAQGQAQSKNSDSVPPVTGMNIAAARKRLDDAKLVAVVNTKNKAGPDSIVVRQEPMANAPIPSNRAVRLTLRSAGTSAISGLIASAAAAISVAPLLSKVPNIVSQPIAVAVDSLRRHRLKLAVTDSIESKAAPHTVVSQNPLPDSVVKALSTVGVVISIPIARVEVPDLSKQTLEVARMLIRQRGLAAGAVRQSPSTSVAGTVIDQAPKAYDSVERGTPVVVTLAVAIRLVPDVTDSSPESAADVLRSARLIMRADSVPGSVEPYRRIFSQDPVGNSKIPTNNRTVVVHFTYRAPIVMPTKPDTAATPPAVSGGGASTSPTTSVSPASGSPLAAQPPTTTEAPPATAGGSNASGTTTPSSGLSQTPSTTAGVEPAGGTPTVTGVASSPTNQPANTTGGAAGTQNTNPTQTAKTSSPQISTTVTIDSTSDNTPNNSFPWSTIIFAIGVAIIIAGGATAIIHSPDPSPKPAKFAETSFAAKLDDLSSVENSVDSEGRSVVRHEFGLRSEPGTNVYTRMPSSKLTVLREVTL